VNLHSSCGGPSATNTKRKYVVVGRWGLASRERDPDSVRFRLTCEINEYDSCAYAISNHIYIYIFMYVNI